MFAADIDRKLIKLVLIQLIQLQVPSLIFILKRQRPIAIRLHLLEQLLWCLENKVIYNYYLHRSIVGLSFPAYLQIDYTRDIPTIKELSVGGFGVAYIADALSPKTQVYGPQVVVKQIKKKEFNDQDFSLFKQEISLMEYFKAHPNISKIIGFTENPFCIIMKYYKHGSLKDGFLKRRRETQEC